MIKLEKEVAQKVVEKEVVTMEKIQEMREQIKGMRKTLAKLIMGGQGVNNTKVVEACLTELSLKENNFKELLDEFKEFPYSVEEVEKMKCKVINICGVLHTIAFFYEDTDDIWEFLCNCDITMDGLEVCETVGDGDMHIWDTSTIVKEKTEKCARDFMHEVVTKFLEGDFEGSFKQVEELSKI